MTTAWKLLQQEWKLSQRQADVLTVLLTETPVALQGEEALAPMTKLRVLSVQKTGFWDSLSEEANKAELVNLFRKPRQVAFSDDTCFGFSFLAHFTLADNSKFLRYQLSPGLIRALHAIKQEYKFKDLV